VLRDAGQLVGESVDDPIELGVHTGCVGLVVDAVQQAFTPDTVDFEPVTSDDEPLRVRLDLHGFHAWNFGDFHRDGARQ
jgi:hypothetical protein